MARPGTVRKIHSASILIREYLHEFLKKLEMVQLGYSGARGKLIHENEAENLVSDSL
jgi:hypothetical protein